MCASKLTSVVRYREHWSVGVGWGEGAGGGG